MVALVDYYRYYVPVAPTLKVTVLPTTVQTIAAQNVNVYNGTYNGETTTALGFTPYGTDFVDVFINGVNIINKVVNSVEGGYTYSAFTVLGSNLSWVMPPNTGDTLKIVSYLGNNEQYPFRIDLSAILIQGKIYNNKVPTFTGSVECYPVIMSQPLNGFVRIAWDRKAFEYSPQTGKPIGDSFSYKLVSRYGQESESACIFINQGNNTSIT